MAPPQELPGHEPVVSASPQCLGGFTGRGESSCSVAPQKKEIKGSLKCAFRHTAGGEIPASLGLICATHSLCATGHKEPARILGQPRAEHQEW